VLLVVAFSCDLEKCCTLLDHVLRCDGSHTTSLHRQGDGNASSPSDMRTATAVSTVSVASVILAISPVNRVDFPVVLLLLHGPLATRIKKSSLGIRRFIACVSDREQIGHRLGHLHGDLLHNLDIADSIAEGVDDLDVLDIRDSIHGVAKIFHIVPEALIILLHDGLESLSSRWTLVHALEVSDEHDT
jgi:hypothetical protein